MIGVGHLHEKVLETITKEMTALESHFWKALLKRVVRYVGTLSVGGCLLPGW